MPQEYAGGKGDEVFAGFSMVLVRRRSSGTLSGALQFGHTIAHQPGRLTFSSMRPYAGVRIFRRFRDKQRSMTRDCVREQRGFFRTICTWREIVERAGVALGAEEFAGLPKNLHVDRRGLKSLFVFFFFFFFFLFFFFFGCFCVFYRWYFFFLGFVDFFLIF